MTEYKIHKIDFNKTYCKYLVHFDSHQEYQKKKTIP